MLGERALVVEADAGRHLGQRRRMAQMPARHAEPDLRQVGMRRQPDRALEQADELEGRQADARRPDPPGAARTHSRRACAPSPAPADCRSRGAGVIAAAAAAMALEQPAEGADQQLALAEDVAPLLDGAVHRQESRRSGRDRANMLRVKYGTRSMPRPARHLIERRLRQVDRAVLPALAPAHPAGVRLGRIEDEQGRGRAPPRPGRGS